MRPDWAYDTELEPSELVLDERRDPDVSTCPRPCDSVCVARGVPPPLDRPGRPPSVACTHCGAPAGVACSVVGRQRRRFARGRFHPSRVEAGVT